MHHKYFNSLYRCKSRQLAIYSVKSTRYLATRKMDGLAYYEDNKTNHCLNISDIELQEIMIVSIISTLLLLVPALILQLFFICRYKSTFLHRQFLYTTFVVILLYIISIVYTSTVDVGCPSFFRSLTNYITFVEILQMTTIHLLLLYQLCKHMKTRTIQRLQTLCCNIRPHLWHDVMIVCIQLGPPLPILIADLVVRLKTPFESTKLLFAVENYYILLPLLAVNILLGLICIVLLVLWFGMLWKRRLLKSKMKFVCTQMGHIILVLVVLLVGNILLLPASLITYHKYGLVVTFIMQTFPPVSFSVYILMSIRNLRIKVTSKALVPVTNRHTNPPSTRVSLPTDTAEHAPNFLSPSMSVPSEVTPLIN